MSMIESASEDTSSALERLLGVLLKPDWGGAVRPFPPAVASKLSLLLQEAFSRACRSEDPVAAAERWARLYDATFGASGWSAEDSGRCFEHGCSETRRIPIRELRRHHRERHLG